MDATALAEPLPAMIIATTLTVAPAGLLLWGRTRLRGTTLIAPWGWMLAAVLAVGGIEVIAAASGHSATTDASSSLSFWRQLAAAITVCPAAALLGAKRPQDRPWQFVVLSLALVLCLPPAQAFLFSSRSIMFDTIWNWFLAALLLAGLVNHIGTRYWLAGICWFTGQIVLFWPRLPLVHKTGPLLPPLAGLACLAVAVALVLLWPRSRVASGWNRVWRDWRDAYGLLWGLRVAERFNATAKQQGWNVVLRWEGFRSVESSAESEPDLPPVVRPPQPADAAVAAEATEQPPPSPPVQTASRRPPPPPGRPAARTIGPPGIQRA